MSSSIKYIKNGGSHMYYKISDEKYEQRLQEWTEIEELVLLYQKQFQKDADETDIYIAKHSGEQILINLQTVFKKYLF